MCVCVCGSHVAYLPALVSQDDEQAVQELWDVLVHVDIRYGVQE